MSEFCPTCVELMQQYQLEGKLGRTNSTKPIHMDDSRVVILRVDKYGRTRGDTGRL